MNHVSHEQQNTALNYFFDLYQQDSELQKLKQQLLNPGTAIDLINLYSEAIPHIEKQIWKQDVDDSIIEHYQKLFHEIESLIADDHEDTRHKFIVAIPVADRPQHLRSCLQSLLNLCKTYNYGGFKNGKYSNVSVLISDDSKHEESINQNIEMAKTFTKQGLEVIYFGQKEQKQIIENVSEKNLKNITGNIDPNTFYHKGASITRNITYLKLKQISKNDSNTLFYFIDSDQEFQIKLQTINNDINCYAINYFYYLDKIFSTKQVSILTGKVVGDPPVSPSVMAGNFLEDLICFISRISELKAEQDCQFHQQKNSKVDDASYHDMADLFGFKPSIDSFQYNCKLTGPHDHIKCFTHFAGRLHEFFDGAHPTRKSYYEHEDLLDNIKPARTIYTGNYIFNQQGLKYFIPFANLKLRMAGPTLGRIIKADLGERFVSANLPMLHNRTIDTLGQSEFRPGVDHEDNNIDLSGEFTRQFFGDVMLFSMQELTSMSYPNSSISLSKISNIVSQTTQSMLQKYRIKHSEIKLKISTLKTLLNDPENWWNNNQEMSSAKHSFLVFIDNIEFNFGDNASAYQFINTDSNISDYSEKIINAIHTYSQDMQSWNKTLSEYNT